jgi:hypothetical protein
MNTSEPKALGSMIIFIFSKEILFFRIILFILIQYKILITKSYIHVQIYIKVNNKNFNKLNKKL